MSLAEILNDAWMLVPLVVLAFKGFEMNRDHYRRVNMLIADGISPEKYEKNYKSIAQGEFTFAFEYYMGMPGRRLAYHHHKK